MDDKIYRYYFYSRMIDISGYPDLDIWVLRNFRDCKDNVKKNIKLYALNLMIFDRVAVSRDKSWFSQNDIPSWHGYSKAVKAQDLLIDKRFAKIEEGGYKKRGYAKGIGSILSATSRFKEQVSNIKIKEVRVNTAELYDLIIKETLRKKVTHIEFYRLDKITKEQKRAINSYKDFRLVFLMRSVSVLNKTYFKRMKLGFSQPVKQKIMANVYLTSIVTNRGGGRLCQQGGFSFQNIPKEQRKFLTINGKPTIEVDISASHLSLLYGKVREVNPHPEDSYMPVVELLIRRKDKDIREAVKKCILISLNANNYKALSGAFRTEYPELYERLKNLEITPKMVIEKFGEVHPVIKNFLNTGVSMDCMLAEAEILTKTLLRLKNENILGLPLHDSIITTKGNEERVRYILGEEFFEFNNGYGTDIETK